MRIHADPPANTHAQAILLQDSAWDVLAPADRAAVLAVLPPGAGAGAQRPDAASLRNDDAFRNDCVRYADGLADGLHDPEWLLQAFAAHELRAAGEFDDFLRRRFEDNWELPLPLAMQPAAMRSAARDAAAVIAAAGEVAAATSDAAVVVAAVPGADVGGDDGLVAATTGDEETAEAEAGSVDPKDAVEPNSDADRLAGEAGQGRPVDKTVAAGVASAQDLIDHEKREVDAEDKGTPKADPESNIDVSTGASAG